MKNHIAIILGLMGIHLSALCISPETLAKIKISLCSLSDEDLYSSYYDYPIDHYPNSEYPRIIRAYIECRKQFLEAIGDLSDEELIFRFKSSVFLKQLLAYTKELFLSESIAIETLHEIHEFAQNQETPLAKMKIEPIITQILELPQEEDGQIKMAEEDEIDQSNLGKVIVIHSIEHRNPEEQKTRNELFCHLQAAMILTSCILEANIKGEDWRENFGLNEKTDAF